MESARTLVSAITPLRAGLRSTVCHLDQDGSHVAPSCDCRPMTDRPGPRRIPTSTLRGPNDEVTAVLRQLPYLRELKRQATIFSDNLATAWRRGMNPSRASDDPVVWASLQAALFGSLLLSTGRFEVPFAVGLPGGRCRA